MVRVLEHGPRLIKNNYALIMKNTSIKQIILKLLNSISSEKEIKKYLEKFSSDGPHFAIIKVGGAIIQNDLENLASALAFLNQVGLRPIIIHGAGPKLSSELDDREIEYDFIDGKRVTSDAVLKVAEELFKQENSKLLKALSENNVNAKPLFRNVFNCTISDKKLGFVGNIESIDMEPIYDAINDESLPIIAPLGTTKDGQTVNINADIAAVALGKHLQPEKMIFLTEVGGIYDAHQNIISAINLNSDFRELINSKWLHSGMKLKLEQIRELLNSLPSKASVSITKPQYLTKELFTDAGSGTLIKKGHKVQSFNTLNDKQKITLQEIIESGFNGCLSPDFLSKIEESKFYLSDCQRAAIVMSYDSSIPYMDKFAVMNKAKGEGLGSAVWNKMRESNPQLFWRSRSSNPINKFYINVCDGFQKYENWNIFWIGIEDYKILSLCINYAANKSTSVNYE
jgi:acetylglutamate kinase